MNLSVGSIVALVIGIYVMVALIPGAVTALFGANTTGWDASTLALWGLLPLLIVVVIVMRVYGGK